MTDHFLFLTAVLFLLSAFFVLLFFKTLNVKYLRVLRWLLGFSVVIQWGLLISLFSQTGVYFPTRTFETYMAWAAVLALMSWVMTFQRTALLSLIVLLPALGLLELFLHFFSPADTPAVLPSVWLWTHILLMILGECFFFFSAAVSVVYLLAEYRLKQREVTSIFAQLPSLPGMDYFLGELLTAGFVLLSVGMGLGFFFAETYWAPGWWLDSKVIFCVLTWVFYAALLVARNKFAFAGKRGAFVAVVGFAGVLFLTWGVETLFPSQHQNHRIEQNRQP